MEQEMIESVVIGSRRNGDCPLIELLSSSPWPLSLEDIARTLRVDDRCAAMALKLLRDAGRARITPDDRWIVR